VFRQIAAFLLSVLVLTVVPVGSVMADTSTGVEAPPDPSLPIAELMSFQHEPTGLVAVRPTNWQLDSGPDGFTASSSLGAPDDFVGVFISRERAETIAETYNAPAVCACRVVSVVLLESLKRNEVDGPQPETIDQVIADDGSGTLVVATTTVTPTSRVPVRVMTYARTTVRPDGLIFAYASVPADQFGAEEDFLRKMVDSVALPPGETAR